MPKSVVFSEALESRIEQLQHRQEKDLQLLNVMKKCIKKRVKCDQQFAEGLMAIKNFAEPLIRLPEGDPQIVSALVPIIEDMGKKGTAIQKQAETKGSEVIKLIDKVIEERKRLLKQYHEDMLRIDEEFKKLSQQLKKIKKDYEKYHRELKSCQDKYRNFEKNHRVFRTSQEKNSEHDDRSHQETFKNYETPKKLRKVRDKLCQRLHSLHNEYIFALLEINQYSKDLEAKVIPELNYRLTEALVDTSNPWRKALDDFVYMVFHSKGALYQDNGMKDYIRMDPDSECGDIFANNRRSSSKMYLDSVKKDTSGYTPLKFQFDDKIIREDEGPLKPGILAVDDFTIDGLKLMRKELEHRLILSRKDVTNKEKDIRNCINEIDTRTTLMNADTDTAKVRKALYSETIESKRRMIYHLRRELIHIEAKHERLHHKWELIDKHLQIVDEVIAFREEKSMSKSSAIIDPKPETPSSLASDQGSRISRFLSSIKLKRSSNSSIADEPQSDESLESENTEYRRLEDEKWFHGLLPRDRVDELLDREGDFLVRESYSTGDKRIVISTKRGNTLKHFVVQPTQLGFYTLEGPCFRTISDLVNFYLETGSCLSQKSGTVLKRPILRSEWELNNDDIEIKEMLGKGNFGDVYRGLLKKRLDDSSEVVIEVAIKKCKDNLPDEQKCHLLREAKFLKYHCHKNIVTFIGVCVQREPIMLVMELLKGGSLLKYLKEETNRKNLTKEKMMMMCIDVASGMEYLSSKNLIHRDLAARNCLIGEDKVVKISDFGMSRETIDSQYEVSSGLRMIPVKWTAPEAMNYGRYTTACDVWSFGILMWEVFSLGCHPYQGMDNRRTRVEIENGYRLPSPPDTPVLIYKLMRSCWEYFPRDRPDFTTIRKILENLVNNRESSEIMPTNKYSFQIECS